MARLDDDAPRLADDAEDPAVIYGYPPNIAEQGQDVYGAHWPYWAQRLYRALVLFLWGEDLEEETPRTVLAGHRHDTDESHALIWLQAVSIPFATSLDDSEIEGSSPATTYLGAAVVNWTSETEVGRCLFVLPAGCTRVFPWMRFTLPAGNVDLAELSVHLEFFDPADANQALAHVDAGILTISNSAVSAVNNELRSFAGAEGINLSTIPEDANGERTVMCVVSAYGENTNAKLALWELQLPLR